MTKAEFIKSLNSEIKHEGFNNKIMSYVDSNDHTLLRMSKPIEKNSDLERWFQNRFKYGVECQNIFVIINTPKKNNK
jgi:hypothetical protein